MRRFPGFTLVELLVVVVVTALLVAFVLAAVQAAREAARNTQCKDRLRQIALGFKRYHDSEGYFPPSQFGSGKSDGGGDCKGGMYSWHARVLPYVNETKLYDKIDFSKNMADSCQPGPDATMTISEGHANATAAAVKVPTFLCPSDGTSEDNSILMSSATESDNYVANAGWPAASTGYDGERKAFAKYNGLVTLQNASTDFEARVQMASVTDGMSKTAAISERLIQNASDREAILRGDMRLRSFHIITSERSLPGLAKGCTSSATHPDARQSAYLGRAWISGWSPTGPTYHHLKTPNSTNCHFSHRFSVGEFIVTPGSGHPRGVNTAMADGHVRFISDQIEPSIWWAYGSRNGGDETAEQ